jgi:hypothetical protein
MLGYWYDISVSTKKIEGWMLEMRRMPNKCKEETTERGNCLWSKICPSPARRALICKGAAYRASPCCISIAGWAYPAPGLGASLKGDCCCAASFSLEGETPGLLSIAAVAALGSPMPARVPHPVCQRKYEIESKMKHESRTSCKVNKA